MLRAIGRSMTENSDPMIMIAYPGRVMDSPQSAPAVETAPHTTAMTEMHPLASHAARGRPRTATKARMITEAPIGGPVCITCDGGDGNDVIDENYTGDLDGDRVEPEAHDQGEADRGQQEDLGRERHPDGDDRGHALAEPDAADLADLLGL